MTTFARSIRSFFGRLGKSGSNAIHAPFAALILLHGKSRGNKIDICGKLSRKTAKKLWIDIRGNGNRIEIGEGLQIHRWLRLVIHGDGNRIVFGGANVVYDTADVRISKNCRGGSILVGERTTFWNVEIRTLDDGSSIEIGSDCMLSRGVAILNSDEHAILVDGKVVNRAGKLEIGNHVWIGMGASVMKNAAISTGCIVGRNAVVAKRFTDANAVLAGVPARQIKTGVDWSRKSVNEFEIS